MRHISKLRTLAEVHSQNRSEAAARTHLRRQLQTLLLEIKTEQQIEDRACIESKTESIEEDQSSLNCLRS